MSVYGDSIFTINEAVKETEKSILTGVKVKDKDITFYKYKNQPTKKDVEAVLPLIKKAGKILNSDFDEILKFAIREYIKSNYGDNEKDAEKELEFKGLSVDWTYTNDQLDIATERGQVVMLSGYFSSKAMDRDIHTMAIEIGVDVVKNEILVSHVYIDG